MTAWAKNIITDFSAHGNGSTSDTSAFQDFNTWAITIPSTDTITLLLPSGKTFVQGLNGSEDAFPWVSGIVAPLTVSGYGATFEASAGGNIDWRFGPQVPLSTDLAHSGRVATVLSGAQTVTLLDPSDSSKFTVGNWALVSGFDMQGSGFPPNPGFFDYVLISAINAGTGLVTFSTTPLTNSYKSTWPDFGDDQMGPVKLWVIDPGWNMSVEFQGFTVNNNFQLYAPMRDVTFRDVTFGGDFGLSPTLTKSARLIGGSSPTCTMEVDKIVSYLLFDNHTIRRIAFQSNSVSLCELRNGTHVTSFLQGTAQKTVIDGCNIASLEPGAYTSGISGEIVVTNSQIDQMVPQGTGSGTIPSQSVYTMTNGVIKYANALKSQNWVYPGGWCYFNGLYNQQTPLFQIGDITQDASFVYVQTSLIGKSFSDIPNYSSTISIHTHPCTQLTVRNCTGAGGLALNNAPAKAPWGTYFEKAYPGAAGYEEFPYIWGPMSEVDITVSSAHAGAGSPVFYFNFPAVLRPDGTADNLWNPEVDVKTTGARVITPGSVTGSVGADILGSAPGSCAIAGGNLKPTFNADLTGSAVNVNLVIKTDHGVPKRQVARLSTMLHA